MFLLIFMIMSLRRARIIRVHIILRIKIRVCVLLIVVTDDVLLLAVLLILGLPLI